MDDPTRRALARGHTIDITTIGRRTGEPRRIEIVFHNIDGRLIITGMPRADHRRAWLVNLEAEPRLTFHLKGAVTADLPGTARKITDEPERRAIAEWIKANAWPNQGVDAMTAWAPMIEITLDDVAPEAPMPDVRREDTRPASERYVVSVDGVDAGFSLYSERDGIVTFRHTEVDPSFEGQGLGSALARSALDDTRARGLRVKAQCPFIASYLERHPEYQDIVIA